MLLRQFIQVYTKAIVPKPIPDGASKNTPPEMVEAEILLAELLVELPKVSIQYHCNDLVKKFNSDMYDASTNAPSGECLQYFVTYFLKKYP